MTHKKSPNWTHKISTKMRLTNNPQKMKLTKNPQKETHKK